ncbi:MAG: FUSC family protein, partial [Catenulispora sp.]
GVRHWFRRERDAFTQTLKTALACAVAWELAKNLVYHQHPQFHAVLAPVAVLITMQVTIYQTFRRGLQQVAAVLLGVIAALVVGSYIELTWYTLSILVIIALMIGRTLRLGTQVNQVATTSLLVYSLGRGYGVERIWDTLLGAAVGIVANTAVAPPTYSDTAAKELADLADDLAQLCRDVARSLGGTWTAIDARRWLDRSRALFGDSHDAEDVADQAEEAVRYHPRRSALEPEVNRVDQAAICLSHVAAQLNSLLRGLYDLAAGNRGLPATTDVPEALAVLLLDAGRALNRFGRLQMPDRDSRRMLEELKVILTAADDHQLSAIEAMLPVGAHAVERWSVHGALLDGVRRMLYELDPVAGPHTLAVPVIGVEQVVGAST